MSSNYSFLIKLFVILILYQSSFCDDPCIYKEKRTQTQTNTTDANYLSYINSEDGKKQKCFSLSKSDVFTSKCCYDTTNKLCIKEPSGSSTTIECPQNSQVINNCGMAGFYQPVSAERCTEISLVDGFCCFLKTKTKGNACVRKKEIDEDDKNKVSDDIIKYLKRLSTPVEESEIESLKCEGNFLKYFLFYISFLFSFIMI